MSELTCGFIGLGLIGGSIAKALKEFDPNVKIIAYDVSMETLHLAETEKVIDLATNTINEQFKACDYIFLCAPVNDNDHNLETLKYYVSPSCILTDVGSVKTDIHKHIHMAGLTSQFIGGHPMAGSERFGYSNSKAMLLENAYYILTPTNEVSYDAVLAYQNLIKKMKAIPIVLDYDQHDYITAAISHLPHIIASSLVNLVQNSDNDKGVMHQVAAGGFRDITRIASSNPNMWTQICLTNTEHISRLLNDYIEQLIQINTALKTSDSTSLYELFENARIYRSSFDFNKQGALRKVYQIHVDIADQPGVLAKVVNLLADHTISIKNIGIEHNREIEEGILKIEFYTHEHWKQASMLLKSNDYTIYLETEQ